MSLRDGLVKLVQNNDDFSPFYNSTSDLIYKNKQIEEENKAHAKAVADLKLKYNQGQITKEQFDSDMQALLNNKANVVDTTKMNVKAPTDVFDPMARDYRAAQSTEDKVHKEKLEAIENTDADAAIKAAKTKYDKTKAELQEKLNNGTITQEQYDEQLAQADKDFEDTTGMTYNKSTWVNKLATDGAHAVANVASKASDTYANVSNGGAFGNMSSVGISPDGYSTGLRAQAQENVRQAGDEQRNMQQNFQIANRNYRDEAGRDAAMKAASQNAQKVNNAAAGVGGGAAAMLREVVTPDTQAYMNRQDTQRKEGVENQRQMHAAQQEAIRRNTNANGYDYVIADANRYNAAVAGASNDNSKTDGSGDTKDTTKAPEPANTTPAVQDPLQGCTSADLRNLQSLWANENQADSTNPGNGDGNPETGDFKFYTSTKDDTNNSLSDVGVTFNELKATNAAYASRLVSIYDSLKRMLASPTTRTAMFNSAVANARVDTDGSKYDVAQVANESEISDKQLLRDYISGKENATTRAQGGANANAARQGRTVTNRDDIDMSEDGVSDRRLKNILDVLSSDMRK